MGDKVTIKVVAANLGKRQLDYHWVPAVTRAGKPTAVKTAEKVVAKPKAVAKKKK